MNLNGVRKGLREGKSFKHTHGKVRQWLRPRGGEIAEHTVDGGDFGGVAEISIDCIGGLGWETYGWQEI